MNRTLLRTFALVTALTLTAFSSALAGPPWIAIEYPANPFDRTSRDAFLTVRTYHHGELDGQDSNRHRRRCRERKTTEHAARHSSGIADGNVRGAVAAPGGRQMGVGDQQRNQGITDADSGCRDQCMGVQARAFRRALSAMAGSRHARLPQPRSTRCYRGAHWPAPGCSTRPIANEIRSWNLAQSRRSRCWRRDAVKREGLLRLPLPASRLSLLSPQIVETLLQLRGSGRGSVRQTTSPPLLPTASRCRSASAPCNPNRADSPNPAGTAGTCPRGPSRPISSPGPTAPGTSD